MAAKIIVLILCCVSFTFADQKYAQVSALSGDGSLSTPWTLDSACAKAVAGDTVNLLAGTYTMVLAPLNAGSAGSPIVFRPYGSAVCSLYTTTTCINITTDYVIVQGIRAQLVPHAAYSTAHAHNVEHSAIMNCYLYGSSFDNNPSYGVWRMIELDSVQYFRFIGNYVDRQDVDIGHPDSSDGWNDGLRGDGIYLIGGTSKCNIIEGNTVVHVSHYGIVVNWIEQAGDADSYNIVRNNITHSNHVGLGQNGWNKRTLFEGNRSYGNGVVATYKGGLAYEQTTQYSIVRYNMFYDDTVSIEGGAHTPEGANSALTQAQYALEKENRVYNNVFLSRPFTSWRRYPYYAQNDAEAYAFGPNVLVNNIIAYTTSVPDSLCYYWQDNGAGDSKDTLRGNLLWNKSLGSKILSYNSFETTYSLDTGKFYWPQFLEATNIENTPLWVDSTTMRGSRSFTLSATSVCVDAGLELTQTLGTAASGQKVIDVVDASYFHYDWSPYDGGDSLMVGTERVLLDSVDYTNNHLIVKTNLVGTHNADTHVYVLATYSTETGLYTNRMSGSAPDIGPYEYGAPVADKPDTTTNVSPDNGSTQLQPTLIKWRKVTGATKYWLSVTSDGWSHESWYYTSSNTDTSIEVSGFPAETRIDWNVCAGNVAGYSDFNGAWHFYTSETQSATNDTLSWNTVFHFVTLSADKKIYFKDVMRRDIAVMIRAPSAYVLSFDSAIKWPDSGAPTIASGTTVLLGFYRYGLTVFGVVLGTYDY